MVEAVGEEDAQGVLAGVATGAVAAVVAEGDGFGQSHVQAAGPGDAGGHLGHLQGVGEPGPLVVGGEDEDLGLARQPAEGGRVQDAVPVALEAGPPGVGFLGPGRRSPAPGPGWPRGRGGPPPLPASWRPKADHRAAVPRAAAESACAVRRPLPPWPAMVAAQRRLRSLSATSGVARSMVVARLLVRSLGLPAVHGCIVRGQPGPGPVAIGGTEQVDVRIGIVQSAKEVEVELAEDVDRDAIIAEIEASLGKDEGVLWFTDRRGRRVAVPVARVAYVEVGAPVPRAAGRFRRPLTATAAAVVGPTASHRLSASMVGLLDRRLVFVTGKGGVGKTTVAAGLALFAAEHGRRTLVCEVDAKGDVAAYFETGPTGFTAREVFPALWAMSMDTEASLREYLRLNLRIPVVGRIGPLAKAFDFVATAAPGVREILTVGKLCYEVREKHYDLVVVDASATGHIVGQLAAPQAINDLVKVGLIRSQTDWILDILSDPATTASPSSPPPRRCPSTRPSSWRAGWPTRPRSSWPP